jgi:hypothetical protein
MTESDYRQNLDENTIVYPLDTTFGLTPVGVVVSEGAAHEGAGVFVKSHYNGNPLSNDDHSFAVLEGSDFHNGQIEVSLNGAVSPNVSRFTRLFARGYIGVCFRISEDTESGECIYLRPENGPTEDETRKNHAVQYVSLPDYEFDRLRAEDPEAYEAAAEILPATWHKIRVEVEDDLARLFIDDAATPVLVVDGLKLGGDARGQVGLWVGPGTNGFFQNLTISKKD